MRHRDHTSYKTRQNMETRNTSSLTALILQPFGLGDCIWSMEIANRLIAEGYRVIWPVLSQFVEGLCRAYPNVIWDNSSRYGRYLNIQEKTVVDGMLIVPIRWSMEYMKCPYDFVMRAKYEMYDMDWQDWKKGAMWERDEAKERELLPVIMGGYNLINNIYGSDSKMTVPINLFNGLDNVAMNTQPGYSLFDWAATLEAATEIHTVSTSIIYLLEMLDLTCPIHLYPRPSDPKFKQVDYIFTKPYILH